VVSNLDMIMATKYYTMEDIVDLLVENDLDILSSQAALATGVPTSLMGVYHRDTIHACANHARLWHSRAKESIHPNSHVTW
jgi:hypothetical protein